MRETPPHASNSKALEVIPGGRKPGSVVDCETLNADKRLPLRDPLAALAQFAASELDYDSKRVNLVEIRAVLAGGDVAPEDMGRLQRMTLLECEQKRQAHHICREGTACGCPDGLLRLSEDDRHTNAIALAKRLRYDRARVLTATDWQIGGNRIGSADCDAIREDALLLCKPHDWLSTTCAARADADPNGVQPQLHDVKVFGDMNAARQDNCDSTFVASVGRFCARVYNIGVDLRSKLTPRKQESIHKPRWSRSMALFGAAVFGWFTFDRKVTDKLAQFRKANHEPLSYSAFRRTFSMICFTVLGVFILCVIFSTHSPMDWIATQ